MKLWIKLLGKLIYQIFNIKIVLYDTYNWWFWFTYHYKGKTKHPSCFYYS